MQMIYLFTCNILIYVEFFVVSKARIHDNLFIGNSFLHCCNQSVLLRYMYDKL